MHEVHRPAFSGADRGGRQPPVQRDVLPSTDAHPQLEPLEAIQSTDALLVHWPAFAAQQHPDAQEAEPGPGVGELTDPAP